MAITVVHVHKILDHTYCGRGSALGNPFIMRHYKERDSVCDEYQDWFYTRVNEPNFLDLIADTDINLNPQMNMLKDIFIKAQQRDINLGCYCAPKRCHCDTIKTFLENKLEELEK